MTSSHLVEGPPNGRAPSPTRHAGRSDRGRSTARSYTLFPHTRVDTDTRTVLVCAHVTGVVLLFLFRILQPHFESGLAMLSFFIRLLFYRLLMSGLSNLNKITHLCVLSRKFVK